MRNRYLKKKILLVQITCTQNEFVKIFEIKNLGKYHDLYVRSNTLLLADVFEKFRNMWLKIYKLDPAKTFSALGLP